MCCSKGKVVLPALSPTPPVLAELLQSNSDEAKGFRRHIRMYNSALSFASLGVQMDESVANGRGGAYSFRIHGSVYHQIGGLLPRQEGEQPAFAQIYFHDTENELANRHRIAPHLAMTTLSLLQDMMHNVNPFFHAFKNFLQLEREQREANGSLPDFRLLIRAEGSPDGRRYNPPSASEVGVVMLESDHAAHRDIVLRKRSGGLERIDETHQYYDALHYVLIFPFGEA